MSPPTLARVSHERFLLDVGTLAAAIEAENWPPDYLVGLGRGGLVPGAFLSHRLAVPLLSLDISAGVRAFGEALLAPLADLARANRRLLLIDDINDSGRTITSLRETLAGIDAQGERLRFAVLIDNVRSMACVEYRARTIDRAVEKSWFVFPWEQMACEETIAADASAQPDRLA